MPTSRFEIVRVDAEKLDLELSAPFGIASGVQVSASNVLVEVELACGATGLGEAAPFEAVSGETQGRTLATIRSLAPSVIGCSASAWRAIAHRLAEMAPAEPSARCGLEQAVIDAFARAADVPALCLYGGAGAELVTDLTITTGSVEHARASARDLAARGFRTMKIKIGARSPLEDAQRIAAAHEVDREIRILLDANGGYDVSGALQLLEDLERRRVPIALFEQPILPGDIAAMKSLRDRTRVPLCADESARSAADVIALVRGDAIDAVNVKIMKTGISEAIRIVETARAARLGLMIGGMVESEIAMLHSAHLASGLGGQWFADLDTPLFMKERATAEGYPLEADRIVLQGRPGIGVSRRPTH